MWNLKSVLLFIASLFVVIIISMSMANADEKKTITPKEFATTIAEAPGKFGDFIKGEVEKTKEFQKASWAEAKTKWPWNKIFKGKNNE